MVDTGGESAPRRNGTELRCTNCGHENEPGDRYCANCGMPLPVASASTVPPQFPQPEGATATTAEREPDDWRMSSLGPPPKRGRRVWLWVLVGILAVCLLACVGLFAFAATDAGEEWLVDLQTRVAEQATDAAQ